VKSRLIANGNVDALAIDVDTENAVVTLSGRVRTDEEKDLSAEIAQNTPNVGEVRNLLVVDEAS
jgi:osmotically-inducible protein OsmY